MAKPTTKKFRLLWSNSEWQLRPNTPAAYEEAEKKLIDNGWVDGIQAGKNNRDLFIFRGGRANVAVVLASLASAGIHEADISVITKGMPPILGPLFQDAAAGRQ